MTSLLTLFLLISIVSLFGIFISKMMTYSFRRVYSLSDRSREKMLTRLGWYNRLESFFFPNRVFEATHFSLSCIENIFRFLYIVSGVCIILKEGVLDSSYKEAIFYSGWLNSVTIVIVYLCAAIFIGDILARVTETRHPKKSFSFAKPFALFFLTLFSPITHFLLIFSRIFPKPFQPLLKTETPTHKHNVDLLLDEVKSDPDRSDSDKEMMQSLLAFRDKIVREVMVPRVNVFGISVETNIQRAAEMMIEKGYSRIPVYHENIDDIVGVLMLKDLFRLFIDVQQERLGNDILSRSVESLLKNPFYSPETKKVSQLLQEFRQRQTHMSIVVDEYGGTEGIVTIEDILEEIVGEIEDEYDIEGEELYVELPNGGWIVDAKMNIYDVKEKLGIEIPQEGEYDTLGGYVFYRAGTIPSRGFRIHHDNFDIEIIHSNDRKVGKVRIHLFDHQEQQDEEE